MMMFATIFEFSIFVFFFFFCVQQLLLACVRVSENLRLLYLSSRLVLMFVSASTSFQRGVSARYGHKLSQ